jgi:plastocyanin
LRKLIIPAVCAVAVLAIALLAAYPDTSEAGQEGSGTGVEPSVEPGIEPSVEPHIVMPTKSSRPGCEDDGLCYIPETVTAEVGQTIVWRNGDAAFHSVTSGTYEEPDGLFDSGHMDPDATFSHTFEAPGTYVYHCTLHPWMSGVIDVE